MCVNVSVTKSDCMFVYLDVRRISKINGEAVWRCGGYVIYVSVVRVCCMCGWCMCVGCIVCVSTFVASLC